MSVEASAEMAISNSDALTRVIEHRELFHDEMLTLMRRIMTGEMSPLMIAALTVGLRVKKETIGELTAAAQVMREFATPVSLADRRHLVTSLAPVAMARTPSTSPPRRCSSLPLRARGWPSMVGAASHRPRARPM